MQRTYYEKLLADERLGLAGILDSDIAELKASGCIEQPMENPTLNDCRSRYIKAMMHKVEQDIASVMPSEQFARYRVSPAFRELLVQKATQQYWTYEAFLFLRAHGARTVNVGAQASIELLHPIGDLGGIGDVQRMHVWGRDDRSRAVLDSVLRQLEALFDRRRTIVDARQQVKVDL